MEETAVKCSAFSDWSFCVGMCSNEYKGDDWCSCYSSDSVSIALVLDGISSSNVEGDGEECLAKGATAARAVADYYIGTVVPILEESAASEPRLGLLLMAESFSPGRVNVSLRGSLLKWIVRRVRSKLLGLLGLRKKCLVGGQAVLSGVAAIKGGGLAFLQAGDTGLVSAICRVPKKAATPEELAWSVYRVVDTMFRPLPPHTFDGDPSHYTRMSAGLSGFSVEASIVVEPSIAVMPWRGIVKYRVEGWSSLLLSMLYSDGFKATLQLSRGSRELASITASIASALARVEANTAPRILEGFLSIHDTMSDGAPLSLEQLLLAGVCAALLSGGDARSIEAIIEELLHRQPLAVGRDDRTLIIHGVLLG